MSSAIQTSAFLTFNVIESEPNKMELSWMTKYVGKQFLDNTSNDDRAIDSYLVNDARLIFTHCGNGFKEIRLNLTVNNVLNEMYSSNGYTWGYIYGERVTENFYYPQAGINFLVGLDLVF
jgi:iron complex outermembrane receptor protein